MVVPKVIDLTFSPASDGAVLHSAVRFQGDDRVLIQGIRAKHPEAYRAFYRRHGEFVYTILLRTIGTDDELDELVHEVFVRAFKGVSNLKDIEKLRSWLAAVAVHTARDALKVRKKNRWLVLVAPTNLPETIPAPSNERAKAAVETVYSLLDELSIDHRIAFSLRYMQDMELTEVAEATGVSLATIKRRLARAKKQFMALAKMHPELQGWMK